MHRLQPVAGEGVRLTDGPHTGQRGVPLYCPYWGRGCQWSCDTTGKTGERFLEIHVANARARGDKVHLQTVEKAA